MNDKELPQVSEIEGLSIINEHPRRFETCQTHGKDNWMLHVEYIENLDHTITCTKCGWGTKLPGYMRVQDGKIVDLRGLSR